MAASGKPSEVKFQCHVEQRLIGSTWTIIKHTNFKNETKVACSTKKTLKRTTDLYSTNAYFYDEDFHKYDTLNNPTIN